jgi:hypothetical protein
VRLREAGWQVRGTTRDAGRQREIAAAGLAPAVADPDRVATVLEELADVTLVFWLLASATGSPEAVAAIHGPRLERLLEEIVDTPVRGLVYEAGGTVAPDALARGAAIVGAAAARWRIPVALVDADPGDAGTWLDAMVGAAADLTAAGRSG